MRAAPPVRLQVPAARGWRMLMAFLGGLAALSLALWLAESLEAGPLAAATVAAVAALAGALAAGHWLMHDLGELRWDGAAWDWHAQGSPGPEPVALRLAFDLGPALLLELRIPSKRRAHAWLVVSRAGAGARWSALRAAVYSGAAAAAGGPHASH